MLKENTKFIEFMWKLVLLLPFFMIGMGISYAEPLDNIQTTILDYSNNTATVQISWDNESDVFSYQIGCVSCFPNTVISTSENSIVFGGVTPFPNGSIAMLYGLAYDIDNQIIAAKQILVNLLS